MKKWIQGITATLSIALVFASASTVSAVEQKPLSVYIDSVPQIDILTVNGRTMVQLKAFHDPDKLTYSYEQASKTITISDKENKLTVQLRSGAASALVNGKSVKLDAPVTIKNGRTYLPLRFLSETLGGTVKYNSSDKSVIVRTPSGQERFNILMSGSLEQARTIAIYLPKIQTGKEITPYGEGFTTIYTFPRGEALKFRTEYRGLVSYIEVNSDGIAMIKWQKDTIGPNGENGTKPADFSESVYFRDNLIDESVYYGTMDSNGVSKDLGVITYTLDQNFKGFTLKPIEDEVRTD